MAWKWIFDARLGPLNAVIGLVGIPAQSWLFDPVLSLVCLVVFCSWQAIGYAVLIFLVGLKNVPDALYEAARLDGASSLQAFRYIAVPLLKPVMLYVSVITLISSYNIYAQAFVLASDVQGAPGHLVRVLVLDMLENSFRNYRVGYAAAESRHPPRHRPDPDRRAVQAVPRSEPRMSEPDHPSVVGQHRVVGLVIDAVLCAVSLMMLLPLVFLISNAFKTPPELLAWPPTIIPHQPTLENIVSVLRETPLFRWIGNSLIFATLSTASIVSTSAIAGYVLGKFDLPGLPVIFGIIIATAVVPFEVYMIPLYLNVQSAGLLNTWPGLLVGYLIMSFGIFLVRQYVMTSIPTNSWRLRGWTGRGRAGSS